MLEMIHTYSVPDGGRHVVIVTIPTEPEDVYAVLDIPVDPVTPPDVHMVGNGYETHGDAWSAAIEHGVRSYELGRPATAPIPTAT